MVEPTEAQVLRAILRALELHPRVVWVARMSSGAYTVFDGKNKRFVRFGFPGCPDICAGLVDGKTAWIEVKRLSGRLSEDQASFLAKCKNAGIPSGVARSVDDAIRIIE
jgi:hypothetical protein